MILSREQVRQLDRDATEKFRMPGMVLMENAGRGATDVLCEKMDANPGEVLIFCGSGNNAGDGFVLARQLAARGLRPLVVLCVSPMKFHGDCLAQFLIVRELCLPMVELFHAADPMETCEILWKACLTLNKERLWLVDAMLGTGAVGEPREPYSTLIGWMNASGRPILALDVPSGLDCETGRPYDPKNLNVVRASVTCTFAALKPGLVLPEAQKYVGELILKDIGIPLEILCNSR